ncbi:hypothetical protein [Fluviicola sp.]|uniref:hypothetical protein n=1 Tax=Fluviicola sp. TaxID=1917219 RepID=UPI002628DED2|nr:hypothetical protein [Fluviicola sp.]
MFENTKPRIGQELLDVPMGDMIRQMAFAIAEAQIVLDQNSIEVAEMMGGLRTITDDAGNVTFEDSRVYFGTEKITKGEAIARHNSTTNIQQKAEIRSLLASGFTPAKIATPATFEPGVTALAAGKFIDHMGVFFVSEGTEPARQVAYGDLIITSTSASDTTTVLELPRRISMLECGFTPTFYQFVDTIIEVKISIKYTQDGSYSNAVETSNKTTRGRLGLFRRLKSGANVQTSQVNANYSQKYSYSAEGSSLLRTKMVPIPTPPALLDRVQRMMDEEFKSDAPATTTP